MANNEILAVFETFQEQLKEIQGFQSIHVGGHVYGREQDRELRKTLLIETAVEDEEEALQRDLSVLRKLVLTYLVVLLEQMVKSYYRACSPSLPNTLSKVEYDTRSWYTSSLSPKQVQDKWVFHLTKWCDEAEARGSAAKKEFVTLLENYSMSDAFVAGITIRNLEIHNRGIMNEGQYKYAPLCEVGTCPQWDQGLLYQFQCALFLLNSQLKRTLVEQ